MDGNLDEDVFYAEERCSDFNTNKLDKSAGNKDHIIDFIQKNKSEENNEVEEVYLRCSFLT